VLPIFNRNKTHNDNSRRSVERLTLSRFFDERYFPHVKVTKRHIDHDWSNFNTHMRAQLGHYHLDELTNPVLDVWVREQVVSGLQRTTINKHIYLMNRMLNLARHWCLVPAHNPDQQPLKRLILGDYKQRFLTEAEIERLLKCCARSSHPYLLHFVRLLLLTGARKGEARTARWCDINLDKRVWRVPRSKNGRSRRIVLNDNAMATLDSIRKTAERLALPTDSDCYVFTNPRTGRAYDSFYAAWYVARDAAGLEDVRIHDLRHTFASLLINKGVSLYEVQTLLGHSSVQMTQRYAHLAPDRLHKRAEIVGDIVGKGI
jgi:integrase